MVIVDAGPGVPPGVDGGAVPEALTPIASVPSVVTVTLVAVDPSITPPPLAKSPAAPSLVVVTMVAPLRVTMPEFSATIPSAPTPDVLMVSLVSVPVAPGPETSTPYDWTPVTVSALPSVVIVIPVAEIEVGRVAEVVKATRPGEPSFSVRMLAGMRLVRLVRPVRLMLPPDRLRAPGESSPVVTIVASWGGAGGGGGETSSRVIVDPAPKA